MNLAYIDHPFRRKTRSTDFFLELLRKRYAVKEYYPGGDWRIVVERVLADAPDAVLCFQHECFAPVFAAYQVPTVILPMYDGSGTMPDVYWSFFRDIPALNFSKALHRRHLRCGMRSLHVQFYPDPNAFECVEDFDTLRGFLWQRRPDTGIDFLLFAKLTAGQLDAFHLHDQPDFAMENCREMNAWKHLKRKIYRTQWYPDKADFHRELVRCNVYLAPRRSEGIGFSFLEAMASGMCCIAHNEATMNEYIEHGRNGLLFQGEEPEVLNLSEAKAMGRQARISILRGHEAWLKASERIYTFLESLPSMKTGRYSKRRLELMQRFPQYYFRDLNALIPQIKRVL